MSGDIPQGLHHVSIILFVHPIVERDCHGVGITVTGARIILRLKTKPVTVIPQLMDGVGPWPGGDAFYL